MPGFEETLSEIVAVYVEHCGGDITSLAGVDEDENYYLIKRQDGAVARVNRDVAAELFGPNRDKAIEEIKKDFADFREFF